MLCLIDGFNLYHSLRDSERENNGCVRWLDLRGLCTSLLHTMPWPAQVGEIVYFTALAHHIERSRPGTVARHQVYMDALGATGVSIVLGHFKRRHSTCPFCGRRTPRFEEKETDVAIASRLLAPETSGSFEAVLLVTGDTDLAPALATARMSPRPPYVTVAFPFRRVNRQLRQAADASVRLKRAHYARHQLPRCVALPGGNVAERPGEWAS